MYDTMNELVDLLRTAINFCRVVSGRFSWQVWFEFLPGVPWTMSFIWDMYFAASSSTFGLTVGSHNLCNKSFKALAISVGGFWRPLPPKRKAISWYRCRRTAPLAVNGKPQRDTDMRSIETWITCSHKNGVAGSAVLVGLNTGSRDAGEDPGQHSLVAAVTAEKRLPNLVALLAGHPLNTST